MAIVFLCGTIYGSIICSFALGFGLTLHEACYIFAWTLGPPHAYAALHRHVDMHTNLAYILCVILSCWPMAFFRGYKPFRFLTGVWSISVFLHYVVLPRLLGHCRVVVNEEEERRKKQRTVAILKALAETKRRG